MKRNGQVTDNLYLIRCRARALLQRGDSLSSISSALGISRRSISRWKTRSSLTRQRPQKTRPTVVPQNLLPTLSIDISNLPTTLGYETPYWTARLFRSHLITHYGIHISRSTAHRTMRRCGYTPQKPQTFYHQQDPLVATHWLKVTSPALYRWWRGGHNRVLLYSDECAVTLQPSVKRTWGLRGHTPHLPITGTRGRISAISAVSPDGDLIYNTTVGAYDTQSYCEWLQQVRSHWGDRPIVMVIDRASFHRSSTVVETARSLSIRLVYLPPYSPQFNPDEKVWRHLKRWALPADRGRSLEELEGNVRRALAATALNRTLIQNFFTSEEKYVAR